MKDLFHLQIMVQLWLRLNMMLLEDSTNMEYTDSLARLYMRSGNFDAGLSLGKRVMAAEEKNYSLMELMATAYEYKGDPPNLTKSYRNYKKLYEEVGGTKYLLKMAQVGMLQGSFDAAKKKLEEVVASPDVAYIESPKSDGGIQMINVKAGAYMLLANYYFNEGNEKEGVKSLEQALKVEPDYEAATINGAKASAIPTATSQYGPATGLSTTAAKRSRTKHVSLAAYTNAKKLSIMKNKKK